MNDVIKDELKPLVSIVTPVYNGEAYLADCIDSVLKQTYPNWEYTIIDNCSKDATFEIANRYAERDRRIRVCRNETTVDVITNHNIAFRKISEQGKYCKLLQADDFLFPECLEKMVAIAEKYPTVGIVGAYSLAGKKVRNDGLPHSAVCLKGTEIAANTLKGNYYLFWSPSSLLIRSDLIRAKNPFYNKEILHADVDSLYSLLKEYDFGFVHQVLTYIRVHDDSLTAVLTKPMNRTILSNLHLFLLHGPTFLDPDSYRKQLRNKLRQYYHFLARTVFEGSRSDFWQYHKESLDKVGLKFSRPRLILAAIRLFFNFPIRCTKWTIKAGFQRIQNRAKQGRQA